MACPILVADLPQARDNKLTIEDMAGGSFTISNVSALESMKLLLTPAGWRLRIADGHSHHQSPSNRYVSPAHGSEEELIISAVLGLHATKEKPVAINGKVEIRPVGGL